MKNKFDHLIIILIIIIFSGCFDKGLEEIRPGSVPKTAVWNENENRWADLKQDGNIYAWYDSGERAAIYEMKDEIAHGKTIEWHKNGRVKLIMHHIEGKRDGVFKSWRENGNIENISTYVNGKKHGLFQDFDESGNLQVEEKYSNDVLISKKIIGTPPRPSTVPLRADYDFNLKVWQTIDFDSACNCNRMKRWYQNGKIEAEGILSEDDLQMGQWIYYRENGSVQYTATYTNGVKNGTSAYYREDGSKSRTVIYKDGKEVKTEK